MSACLRGQEYFCKMNWRQKEFFNIIFSLFKPTTYSIETIKEYCKPLSEAMAGRTFVIIISDEEN